MSFKRRGCILHHKLINLFQCKNDPDYHIGTPLNSKAIHATRIYNCWQNKKVKQIHSHRLGISYKSQYDTPIFYAHAPPERRMYRKKFYDLQTHHVTDSKTHKKQKLRFERASEERRRELSLRAQLWGTSSYTLELRESMGDTSDDTKELEHRPNKRSDNMSLDNNRQMGPVKKSRIDSLTTEDVNASNIHD
ncbi:uncharacterized protein OCT59_002319 [Rhizophagus irregularis]|uniref:uncharacterized protein n=1 Tax=Rhizophagus irregularis TaxID=588596 RepID=UPI00331B6F04|nr:hypothetical protein OCT59_002319 [Rhizophagus irregularis]